MASSTRLALAKPGKVSILPGPRYMGATLAMRSDSVSRVAGLAAAGGDGLATAPCTWWFAVGVVLGGAGTASLAPRAHKNTSTPTTASTPSAAANRVRAARVRAGDFFFGS